LTTEDEIRDFLLDRNRYLELAKAFISNAVQEESVPEDQGFNKFYELALKTVFEVNERIVFEKAESPIERLFLNSLMLGFLKADSLGLVVHQTNENAEQDIDEFLKYLANFKQFLSWHKDQYASYGRLEEYLDGQLSSGRMTKDEREYIRILTFRYVYLPLESSYHLTLQPRFPETLVDKRPVRPDLLFWKPTNSRLKIIVECDGFDYHSDKTKFTSDRKRDRLFQSKGYRVLRYSGTEIYHHPVKVVGELLEYLWGLQDEKN